MTRILFVMPGAPLAANYSGAASRFAQNFAALRALGAELHVARFFSPGARDKVTPFETESSAALKARQEAASWHDIDTPTPYRPRMWLRRVTQSLVDPVGFQFAEADALGLQLAVLVKDIQPDLIWLEDTEAAAAAHRSGLRGPQILSHHDLLFRVARIRHSVRLLRDRWLLATRRRAERRIIRAMRHIVTGSATDAERLVALGCPDVHVIPVTYDPMPAPPEATRPSADARILHLGSLETTANRVGLVAYLRKAHGVIRELAQQQGISASLWIIGDSSRVAPELANLLKEASAVLVGFVPDLGSILQPFDIAILPYEHDSGYRTKLPLLMGYAQVVVATRAAVAGTRAPGLDKVCVLRDRLEDFPEAIMHLAANPAERERLGRAAHEYFLNHFTPAAVQESYRSLITRALTAPRHDPAHTTSPHEKTGAPHANPN